MKQLAPDHVVLGLLALRPCHGYQLLETFHDSNALGQVWKMSTSQLYAVLKRLEQQGFILGHDIQSTDAPTRTEYYPTEAGRKSLHAWLYDHEPSAVVRRVRVEFLSRLYIARLLDIPTAPLVYNQRRACQLHREALLAQRVDTQPGIGRLALDFMLAQIDAVLQWLDKCE